MTTITIFLGVCIVLYSLFSYLEARTIRRISMETTEEFIKEYKDEIMPIIVEEVSSNLTKIMCSSIEVIHDLSILKDVLEYVDKEEVTASGTENNKKFKRD